MRTSWLWLVAVGLLLGLVLLLPERTEAGPLPGLDTSLRPLDLTEPPAWALGAGGDEIERSLDRLYWGGPVAVESARRVLRQHRGELRDEVLGRLKLLGEDQPVTVQKLLEVLGEEDLDDEAVLEELIRRSYSPSSLVAKSALRILAHHPDERATAGVYARLDDSDPDVRLHARAALARRARDGDPVAQDLVLEELAAHPAPPDYGLLSTADVLPPEPLEPVLEAIVERGDRTARFVVLSLRLKRGEPEAIEEMERILSGGDPVAGLNVLQAAAGAGRVLGRDQWHELARSMPPLTVLALVDLLLFAVDSGHESAMEAMMLLEDLAARRFGNVGDEVLDALLVRQHPFAIEKTRAELQVLVGAELSRTIDRVIAAEELDRLDYVAVSLTRLAEPQLDAVDRLLLLRLVAHVAPSQAAVPVVDAVLEWHATQPALAQTALDYMDLLGIAGLNEVQRRVGEPGARELMVYTAARVRSGVALPALEAIILDTEAPLVLRVEALDTIARLHDGPREDSLRRVAELAGDEGLRSRARLLYWNYL